MNITTTSRGFIRYFLEYMVITENTFSKVIFSVMIKKFSV